MWKPRLIETAPMKYLGIVEALEHDIRAGRVAAGARLPPQRDIARMLEVDLTTVTRAFNEARRRNLIEGQVGRGTFVKALPEPQPTRPAPSIDLSMNIPPLPPRIDFCKLFSQGMADILATPIGMLSLQYQDSRGTEDDRRAAAGWLGARIPDATPDAIVLTGGSQTSLYALCTLLLCKGDIIAAAALTYPGIKSVAAQQGLTLAPVAIDEQGLIPESFEAVCRDHAPRLLYVTPTIANPTTATIPDERRHRIALIARKYGVAILEDDPYVPLHANPIASFREHAPDITWHVASLSKCATPALRIAYVLAPDAIAASRLAAIIRATLIMAPPLMAALATRWIKDGTLATITRAIVAENRARQAVAATILNGLSIKADPCGSHLWIALPQYWNIWDFARQTERLGLAIAPASAFTLDDSSVDAIRISLGAALDRQALAEGLQNLASLLDRPMLVSRAFV